MTAGENISLSNVYDIKKLNKICNETGFSPFISQLSKEYNT